MYPLRLCLSSKKNGRDLAIVAVCLLHNLKCQTVGGEVMMMPDRVVLIGGIVTSSRVRCGPSLPLAVQRVFRVPRVCVAVFGEIAFRAGYRMAVTRPAVDKTEGEHAGANPFERLAA